MEEKENVAHAYSGVGKGHITLTRLHPPKRPRHSTTHGVIMKLASPNKTYQSITNKLINLEKYKQIV